MARRSVRIAAIMFALTACEHSPTSIQEMPSSQAPRAPAGPAATDLLATSIGFTKTCSSPTNIGAADICSYFILNAVANSLVITGLSDVVHAAAGDVASGNFLNVLSLVFTGSVSCSGGAGSGTSASPYVGATSCSLASGASIHTGAISHYTTVQAADYTLPNHLLTDEASLTWYDTCTPDATGCSTAPQTAIGASSTLVQQLTASTTTAIHNAAHQVVTTIELGGAVHDFVTVTGQGGSPSPSGAVTIDWFTNSTCSGSPTQTSSAVALDASGQADAIAFTFTPTAAGPYGFQASYSGDALYVGSPSACEPLTVVDANIQISPASATNAINTGHVLTGHVNVSSGSGYVNAPDGTQISFNIFSGPGFFTTANPCTTSGGTGSCTITLTSAVAGTTTVAASVTVSVGGITLNRTTVGSGGNSAMATKEWVVPNPVVTVTKSCPNGKQSAGDTFGIAVNGTATSDVLDCGQSVTVTLQPSTAFNITERATGATTNLLNYSISYSGCEGTGLASGATATCTITNTLRPPRSAPFSVGYWKNHAELTGALLPISLGSYLVTDIAAATEVFNAMDCGASKDLGVVGCLAGQLLAAKLNVKNGASNCINSVIASADAILVAAGYQGSSQPLGSPLTNAQRQEALRLTSRLEKYNSGRGC